MFMFFATFASTVALGVVVDDKATGTNNCMGVTELLLSLSIAGMLHSLFSGCPMAVRQRAARTPNDTTHFTLLYTLYVQQHLNFVHVARVRVHVRVRVCVRVRVVAFL